MSTYSSSLHNNHVYIPFILGYYHVYMFRTLGEGFGMRPN
jgi:hypothetical protein